MRKIVSIITLLLVTQLYSQNIIVNKEIKKIKNDKEYKLLINSLNSFLKTDIKSNKWISPSDFLETLITLNEIENIKDTKIKKGVFKPYLTNIIPIENSNLFIQISYIGIKQNRPLLKASIELIATKQNTKYTFSSPLRRNTKKWKTRTIDNFIIHYRDSINLAKINHYQSLTRFYDDKLEIKPKTTKIYFCNDDLEAQQLFGLINWTTMGKELVMVGVTQMIMEQSM